MKRCTKCGNEYPATTEHFHSDRQKRDGLYSSCRGCAKSPAQRKPLPAEKPCTSCRDVKPATSEFFAKKPGCRGGLSSRCKNCDNAYRRAWKKANPEKTAQYQTVSAARNIQSRKESKRAWKLRNADVVREQKRLSQRRRRARRKNANGSHTIADVRLQYKSQMGQCWWCGVLVGEKYEVDHRIPLAAGGDDGPANICVACPSCNRLKTNKMPWEWNGRLL